MRTQTRKGLSIIIDPKCFVKQHQVDLGHEVYYVASKANGTTIELKLPIGNLSVEKIDKKPKEIEVTMPQFIESNLLKAEDCPSAGESTWSAAKQTDPHSAEKYKGETFYTHKSAPGLVIKKQGMVIYETKMTDMYRRRDQNDFIPTRASNRSFTYGMDTQVEVSLKPT